MQKLIRSRMHSAEQTLQCVLEGNLALSARSDLGSQHLEGLSCTRSPSLDYKLMKWGANVLMTMLLAPSLTADT